MPPPGYEEVQAEARSRGCSPADALEGLLKRREKIISDEIADPLRYGWEPPIWKVCDAILGFKCYDKTFLDQLHRRLGMDWETFRAAILDLFELPPNILMLLVMGANRSSKSEYAAKRCQQVGTYEGNSNIVAYHMSEKRSVRDQQPLFWKYMLPEWRQQKATESAYIKYKKKTGFSEQSFINFVGSEFRFNNYTQDRDTAIEGLEANLVHPDELIPSDWLETLKFRLTTRGGKCITTFTPVSGYTPSVGLFCDGAETAWESTAFCLPKDGGEPDCAAALGLSQEEYDELVTAETEKRPSRAPYSRPEDIFAWLEGKPSQPDRPGRIFHNTPRILRSADPRMAVVFFHSCDNPYGNPRLVIDMAREQGTKTIRTRVYGTAERMASTVFPKFSIASHVISASAIPTEGTNFMLCDPCGDRNWFMTWIRATPDCAYVYREWPGNYEIPGQGVTGPWSVPSAKKEGLNDGAKGEAQESFGFGLLRYKFELARLEKWFDYMAWFEDVDHNPNAYPHNEEIESWDDGNGAMEVIEQRIMDSRAASTPRVEKDRPITLMEDMLDIGVDFLGAPGADVSDGLSAINTALDYDEGEDGSYFNKPKLLIAKTCRNTIYSLSNYRNADGQKGACKDPIDNLRYYFTSLCEFIGDQPRERRGHHYGRGSNGIDHSKRQDDRPRPGCMDRTFMGRAGFRGR